MRLPVNTRPSQSLRLAALFLVLLTVLLAVLAVSLSGSGPAGAADYEPDQEVVEAVEGYSKEFTHGYDHVLRWMRVLTAFGVVQGMTAADAQDMAEEYSADRWDPVVAELSALEADSDYEPDAGVVKAVEGYSKEFTHGYDHVLRWMRVLKAFGAIQDMTASEAQGYADTYSAERWDPVVAELTKLEQEPEQDGGASGSGGPSGQGEPGGGDGPSGQQQSCTITLTVNLSGPHAPGDDPANPRATYDAVLSWTAGPGCAAGGVIFNWKAPGETDWYQSPSFPESVTTYTMGFWRTEDDGTHTFLVTTTDSTGFVRTSNQVTVTIPAPAAPTPVPTPAPHPGTGGNKPYDLQVGSDNQGGFNLDWEAPTLASNRVLSAYVIEYRKSGETTATTLTLDTSTYRQLYTQRRIYGSDIDVGSQYQARVRASHTASDGTDSQNTDWTAWSALVEAWTEPLAGWYHDNTPNYSPGTGRVFLHTNSNHANASGVCIIRASNEINCPPLTLTSLHATPGGIYSIGARFYGGGQNIELSRFNGRMKSAPPPPVRASGGDGNLYVGWHAPYTLIGGGCHPYSGNLAGFKVQYRKQRNNGTWPDWSDANSVTKGGWEGLYRVKSYGGDSASVVWDFQEEGASLLLDNGSTGSYRGIYSSFDDLPLTGNTGGDVALVLPSTAVYRWVRAVGVEPHWAQDDAPAAYLGHFGSEYGASQEASASLQYAVFVSREHTWTGLPVGTYQVRVAAVGDGARTGEGGCHDGTNFHENGRGFWSHELEVGVSSSQAPGKVTDPSLERTDGRVTIRWDQPDSDNGSDSWALIRYRPVGSDPDHYDYTYIPGVPGPSLLGLHFHEVTRICDVEGEAWTLQTESEGNSLMGVQACTNPRVIEFDVQYGKAYEVGIAAVNANGASEWHNFDHFWYGPR